MSSARDFTEILDRWRCEHKALVMMFEPSYYVTESILPSDIRLLRSSWDELSLQKDKFSILCSVFYERLFDMIPNWRSWQSICTKINEDFLFRIIESVMLYIEDLKKLENYLVSWGVKYSKIGVRTLDFGVIGDVLLWSFDRVLKKEMEEDPSLRKAWCKLYSQCLRTLIPVSMIFLLQLKED